MGSWKKVTLEAVQKLSKIWKIGKPVFRHRPSKAPPAGPRADDKDNPEMVLDLLEQGSEDHTTLVKLLGVSPDPVGPRWREPKGQFELVTDNKGNKDIICGAALAPPFLRNAFVNAGDHIQEMLELGWGVGNGNLSWARWVPRAYNCLSDFLCHLSTRTGIAYLVEDWEELSGDYNLQCKTDGGYEPLRGGVAAWAVLVHRTNGQVELGGFGTKLLPMAHSAFEAEAVAMREGFAALSRATHHDPRIGPRPSWGVCKFLACAAARNA